MLVRVAGRSRVAVRDGVGGRLRMGQDLGLPILAWRIQWTEEPGQLLSVRPQRVKTQLSY